MSGAGLIAGIINTAVGSGSLVTYPALLLVGVPPVIANVTNTLGLAPSAVAGALAYRAELREQGHAVMRLVPMAVAGAVIGASLLLVLPATVFTVVVPALIIASVVLVAVQPLIARRRQGAGANGTRWAVLSVTIFAASVYGGYFSASQGIILLGILGLLLHSGMQAQNALKNLLQAVVNVVAALFFVFTSEIDWLFAGCIAVGAIIGAPIGAMLARRLPAKLFRIVIVAFGSVVACILIITR
ncbi:MAG: sulfite exporter TauE/SafE family protein [Microbacteriaceae bacterium]